MTVQQALKQEQDVAVALAHNIVATRYEDIPAKDREETKKRIIDAMGCTLTGYQDLTSRNILELMVEQGGKPEATVIGSVHRLPAASAAHAMGTLCRAFDFEDCHEGSATHCSVTAVPGALALAERLGGVSGHDLIAAVTLGNDLTARLSLAGATGPGPGGPGFGSSMIYGTFGAAAAAGKILGLNETQMVNALGIAMTRTAGSMQYSEDAGAYQINFGFASQLGVLAALMAQRGVFFARRVFQGSKGFFNLYKGGDYKVEELTADLGKRFEGSNVSIKPYPCCKITHTSVAVAEEARKKFGLTEDNVEDIEIRINQSGAKGRGELVIRFDPNNRFEARWGGGIEKLAAMMIIKGTITIDDMTGKNLGDEVLLGRVARLAKRIKVTADPVLSEQYAHGAISPAIMRVRMKDGRELNHRTDYVKGHPKNPMSLDEVLDKFRLCAPYAQISLDKARTEKAVGVLRNLENVQSINEVVALLR